MMVCAAYKDDFFDGDFDGVKKTTRRYILCCDTGDTVSEKVVTKDQIKVWCEENFEGMAKIAEEELFAGYSVVTKQGRFLLKVKTCIEVSDDSK